MFPKVSPTHRRILRYVMTNDEVELNEEVCCDSDTEGLDDLQPRVAIREAETLTTQNLLRLKNDSRNAHSRIYECKL